MVTLREKILKEIKRDKKRFSKDLQLIKYSTKCGICRRSILTIKNTANEGICYSCRSV